MFSAINGISGKKAQLNSRHAHHVSGHHDGLDHERVLRPPSPKVLAYPLYNTIDLILSWQSVMMHHTLKEDSLPVFKEWLKSATSNGKRIIVAPYASWMGTIFYTNLERNVLFEMLHAAHEDTEEARLSKVREYTSSESGDVSMHTAIGCKWCAASWFSR